jgi:hypothetical protein
MLGAGGGGRINMALRSSRSQRGATICNGMDGWMVIFVLVCAAALVERRSRFGRMDNSIQNTTTFPTAEEHLHVEETVLLTLWESNTCGFLSI